VLNSLSLIIKHVDVNTDTIIVRNIKEGVDIEYIASDENVLALAIIFKNKKPKKIIARQNIISDIRGRIKIRIMGSKTVPRGIIGAKKEKPIIKRYEEHAKEFMTYGIRTGSEDIIGIVVSWILVTIIGCFIGFIVYLLPLIVLAVASIFTFGETYKMRHTIAIKCSLHRRNINRFREYIKEVIMHGACVRGIPPEFVGLLGFDVSIYKRIRNSFSLLVIGLILICGCVAILLIVFLYTIIRPGLKANLLVDWIMHISGALIGLGFVLLLVAGWIHRIYSPKIKRT